VTDVVAADVLAAIIERTDGNPFYVTQSARLLASGGPAVVTTDIPTGVADVIRRRVAQLPAVTQGVLQTVAVVGRDADVRVVVSADAHDEDQVYDALETAVVTGLLDEPAAGVVRFTHALVRETVYTDLPRLRSARAHARVAVALEQLRPDDVAALAHHHAEAATLGLSTDAIRWCRAAAAQAAQRFAHTTAVQWWQRARALLEAGPGELDRAEHVEVLVSLARAQQLAGRAVEARATRAAAAAAAAHLHDPALTARAITSIDAPMLWSNRAHGVVDHELVEAVRDSLRQLPEGDTTLRARLLATLALESGIWGDPDGARRAAEEAVDLARRSGAVELLAVALNAAYYAHRVPTGLRRVSELGTDLEQLGTRHRMPGVEALGLLAQCVEPGARGELDLVTARGDRALALSETYDLPHLAVMVALQRAAVTAVRDDLATALARYETVERSAAAGGMYDVSAVATIGRICVHHVHGRITEAAQEIAAVDAVYPLLAAPMLACLHAWRGDVEVARRTLAAMPPPAEDYLMTLLEGFRVDAAVAVADHEVAGAAAARLAPYADLVCGGETNAMPLGPVALRLADVADLQGRGEVARRHRRRARQVAERAGSPVWMAMLNRTGSR
jgi:hypothetical protein